MSPFLNLLPWRQRGRLRQLRRWILIASGCLILGVIAGIALPNLMVWRQDLLRLESDYLVQMNSALQSKYQDAQELKNRQKIQEEANAKRQALAAWEARLTLLARQLPVSVWLTSVSLKNHQMLIKGHAIQAADIQRVEASLNKLDGISAIKAGAIHQDTNGLMGFTFTMSFSEVIHVLPG